MIQWNLAGAVSDIGVVLLASFSFWKSGGIVIVVVSGLCCALRVVGICCAGWRVTDSRLVGDFVEVFLLEVWVIEGAKLWLSLGDGGEFLFWVGCQSLW